jgi:hypothetical protein
VVPNPIWELIQELARRDHHRRVLRRGDPAHLARTGCRVPVAAGSGVRPGRTRSG